MTDSQQAQRPVGGTYRGAAADGPGRLIEIRVDVDGHRPQRKVSGDVYRRSWFPGAELTSYVESFVVGDPEVGGDAELMTIRGRVATWGQPGRTSESLQIFLPRVPIASSEPPISVNWLVDGVPRSVYGCRKISEFFRTATLEVDRFQGSVFPADLDPVIDPSPGGLPGAVSVRSVFADAGIDLGVVLDDVPDDPDGPDPGSTWSVLELHDLMEARFDSFSDTPQWKLYGVVVPRIDNPSSTSVMLGVMFDWGGWQEEDKILRQGCAVADEAVRSHEAGAT